MKSLTFKRIGLVFGLTTVLWCATERAAIGQECPLILPASPSNQLSSYITVYPFYNKSLSQQQQLISYFLVDVTNKIYGTNYPNPPIPDGLYPAWCVDEYNFIAT